MKQKIIKSWRRGAERRQSDIEKSFHKTGTSFPIYEGTLSNKKIKGTPKKAYSIWKSQRERCTNKNNLKYHLYGGKGITTHYSSRQFIGWWLYQIKGKNYSFDNIRLVPFVENCGHTDRTVAFQPVVWHPNYGDILFPSISAASKISGFRTGQIWHQCKRKTSGKRIFTYAE